MAALYYQFSIKLRSLHAAASSLQPSDAVPKRFFGLFFHLLHFQTTAADLQLPCQPVDSV